MKTMNELNVFASLLSPKASVAALDILASAASDLKKFVNGDIAASKLLKNNIRMFEVLPI